MKQIFLYLTIICFLLEVFIQIIDLTLIVFGSLKKRESEERRFMTYASKLCGKRMILVLLMLFFLLMYYISE